MKFHIKRPKTVLFSKQEPQKCTKRKKILSKDLPAIHEEETTKVEEEMKKVEEEMKKVEEESGKT